MRKNEEFVQAAKEIRQIVDKLNALRLERVELLRLLNNAKNNYRGQNLIFDYTANYKDNSYEAGSYITLSSIEEIIKY